MEFLDYEGLEEFKEQLDLKHTEMLQYSDDKYATKEQITKKNYTSVINPDNTREKFNDNQVYFNFDNDSGNQDKKINLFINKDNDFNDSHVGVLSYHFMDGLSCPADGLKGDYSYIVAKGFIVAGGGESPADMYTKGQVDAIVANLQRQIDELKGVDNP